MSKVVVVLSFLISNARVSLSLARRRGTSLPLLLLLFATIVGCAADHRPANQRPLDSEQVVALVRQYVSAASKSDFAGAARLFEYPPSYSAQELNKDLAVVAQNVSFAQAETGTTTLPNGVTEGTFLIVGFGGGNIKYWGQGPKATSFVYRAVFADGMEGQLSFDVVATRAGYRLRQVKYGFPSTSAGAVRAKSLYEKVNSAVGG